MTLKDSFRRAAYAVKHGTIGAAAGAVASGVVISALGLMAHGAGHFGDDRKDHYSLKNRFETAYCLDTPESHKYYYSTPVVNGYEYGDNQTKEYYLAHPYATYGAMGAAAAAGAILFGGAGVLMAKEEEEKRRQMMQQQKTR